MQGSPRVTLAMSNVNSFMSGADLYDAMCAVDRKVTKAPHKVQKAASPLVALSMKYTPRPNCRSSFINPLSATVSMASGETLQKRSASLVSALVTGQLREV